ncbi:DUF3108 domain-containing protein [Paucibacter sp. APW11]|uniref:DUF3108 domain-containing protein n=1 Tax=Roseateles aquae TaxID=3077235 RepID=A0ABU3PGI5_9BURK|nr:DUF3108 domain-containing protein [Paucibacter sp. APW11]MDT9001228.1 DUF3108 domain-containing protein [Paucibacter sp. APW11]
MKGLRRAGLPGLALLVLAVLAVLILHGCVADRLAAIQADWRLSLEEVAPMPPRLEAAFVRQMVAAAPRAMPTRAPKPPTPRQQPAAVPHVQELALPESAASAVAENAPAAQAEAMAASSAASAVTDLPPVVAESPALPASAVAAADDEPGPEWPASTQLRYKLVGNYRGAVTGHAQVQWLRQGRRYQVHLDVGVGPSFAPLISRRMSSDGELGPQGISPKRYDEDTRVLFAERRRVSVLFQPGQVQLGDGRLAAAPAGVQDSASQFVQLTWLFLTGREQLRPGLVIQLPLALPRRVYAWAYEVMGEETLETPMGPLATWHLRPLREAVGGDLKSEVWLAPALQYLPVRLRIRQDEQTFIDLMLEVAPLQAER